MLSLHWNISFFKDETAVKSLFCFYCVFFISKSITNVLFWDFFGFCCFYFKEKDAGREKLNEINIIKICLFFLFFTFFLLECAHFYQLCPSDFVHSSLLLTHTHTLHRVRVCVKTKQEKLTAIYIWMRKLDLKLTEITFHYYYLKKILPPIKVSTQNKM